MTGTINLDGDLAVVEDSSEWIIAQESDVEQKSDGSWGLVDGASALGTLSARTVAAAVLSGDVASGSQITNLVGTNLTVNGGDLEATDTDTTDHSQFTNVQRDQHHPALSVSDDGSLTLAEPTDISFGSDLDVIDESDGTVRVDFSGAATDTDTRTNVSEGGTELVTDVTDIDFAGDVSVTDDGDESVTVTFTDTDTDTDTRVDVTDGTTSVADPTEATFTGTGAASVSVTDNSDGTVTVDVSATDSDTTDHSQLTNVQSGQHHSKTTSTDLESGGSDPINVGGLPGDLADPQDPQNHSHPLGDLDASGASSGQVAKYDGSNWVPGTDETGSGGGTSRTVTTVTTDHTAADGEIVLVDASGGAVTVTLPTASSGLLVDIVAIDATNAITVASPNSETIGGASSVALGTDDSVLITSDGTNYQTRARRGYADDDPLSIGAGDDYQIEYSSSGGQAEIRLDGSLAAVYENVGSQDVLRLDHLNFNDEVVEIGNGASANRGTDGNGNLRHPIAIGNNASANRNQTVALGEGTNAGDTDAIAIGNGANAGGTDEGPQNIAIGKDATATSDTNQIGESGAVSIGKNTSATELGTICISPSDVNGSSKATGDDSMAIGADNVQATARNSMAIGEGSQAYGTGSISIGKAAKTNESVATGSVAIGSNTNSTSRGALSQSPYTIAIGSAATVPPTTDDNSIAIGKSTIATEANCIAFGAGTSVGTPKVARIGDGSVSEGPDQLVFTATQDTIADGDLNNGEMTAEMDESAGAFRLRGKDSNGNIREATVPW